MRGEILARGRHCYTDNEELGQPVWWLVRLWPDPQHLDAMAGPPRRIAGDDLWVDALQRARWAWLDTWASAGWPRLFGINPAYQAITGSLRHPTGRARTRDELAEFWATGDQRLEPAQRRSWQAEAMGTLGGLPYMEVEQRAALDLIAQASGRPPVSTFEDVLEAFISIGLLLPVGGSDGPLEPNPAPPGVADFDPSWEPSLTERFRSGVRIEEELQHLVRWAPDQVLSTRPVDIATRLSVSPRLVVEALRRLPWSDWYTVEHEGNDLSILTPITVRAAGTRATWASQEAEKHREQARARNLPAGD
jgi:hypothetical protein